MAIVHHADSMQDLADYLRKHGMEVAADIVEVTEIGSQVQLDPSRVMSVMIGGVADAGEAKSDEREYFSFTRAVAHMAGGGLVSRKMWDQMELPKRIYFGSGVILVLHPQGVPETWIATPNDTLANDWYVTL